MTDFRAFNTYVSLTKLLLRELCTIHKQFICGSAHIKRDFPWNIRRAQHRISPVWGLCVPMLWIIWFVSNLFVILPYLLRNSSVIFHRINQRIWSISSTDKHTQPNFMRKLYFYVLVGQCDWAFTGTKRPSCMRHMSANRQWKVVDEHDSGIFCADDHRYPTYISQFFRLKTT
jgi:hypothetical protein